MAGSCLVSCHDLHDAMEGLWFHVNILSAARLCFNTNPIFLESSTGNSYQASLPQCNLNQGHISENSEQKINKKPTPTKLEIITIIQSPLPCGRSATVSSCPSLPAVSSGDTDDLLQNNGVKHQKTTRTTTRSYRRNSFELESYEVKGFHDLGFVFREEEIFPEIVNLIPGLRRMKCWKNKYQNACDHGVGEEEEEDDENEKIRRPYLSEAWLVNLPPPLHGLNLLVHSGDVKKRLRLWAKNVALLANR